MYFSMTHWLPNKSFSSIHLIRNIRWEIWKQLRVGEPRQPWLEHFSILFLLFLTKPISRFLLFSEGFKPTLLDASCSTQLPVHYFESYPTSILSHPTQLPFSPILSNFHSIQLPFSPILSNFHSLPFYPTSILSHPTLLPFSPILSNFHSLPSYPTSILPYPIQLPFSPILSNFHSPPSYPLSILSHPIQLPFP